MLKTQRKQRKRKIIAKIRGTASIPRVSVFRSNKFIYAQIINDEKHQTILSQKSKDPKELGQLLVQKAKDKKIKKLVFDRSGYKYHGKVKAVAQILRENKLIN
jgi:large subunit ribosomal protein L18